jgi:SAM-dependent methyltransferase
MTQLIKLDLGSGKEPEPGYIGVDIGFSSERVIQSDALTYLKSLPAESVSHVYSRHYLEHMTSDQLIELLKEVNRVLAKGGEILFIVPHFSNPYYYSDPTHKTPFGVHSFSYFCEKSCLLRYVPRYVTIKGWSLERVRVNFLSLFSFKLLGIKFPKPANILNKWLNRSTYAIEVFERYFAFMLSIYEVEFLIRKE